MKPWMKILMWFGLGAGIGFFAGVQVGANQRRREEAAAIAEEEDEDDRDTAVRTAMQDYRGDEDGNLYTVTGLAKILKEPIDDEDDSWMEEPVMPVEPNGDIDGDEAEGPAKPIPQLHPTQLLPKIVTEDEFYQNPWEFEEETLVYYEGDEVLFNTETQTLIEYPENVIGVGTLFEFRVGPGEPVNTIFVINEIFGKRFRIERVDGAFREEVDGGVGPEDDDPEDDGFWDDV